MLPTPASAFVQVYPGAAHQSAPVDLFCSGSIGLACIQSWACHVGTPHAMRDLRWRLAVGLRRTSEEWVRDSLPLITDPMAMVTTKYTVTGFHRK